ncbi:E3 ubiquitin-protein ligase HECW2-like isoform X2 [Rhopilema esculentum]
MDSCGYNKFRTVTQPLVGRNPSEKVQGTFQFTIFVRKSNLPKSEQEADQVATQAKQRPVTFTGSSPLDDMALPSGQPKGAGASKRPLSYHPPSSYQIHCATEPRNRNYTTNYFASAAFRSQGHPSTSQELQTQRNRTSNSLCHDHLSTLSSEESESQDDDDDNDDNDPQEVQGTHANESEMPQSNKQNGHAADSSKNSLGILNEVSESLQSTSQSRNGENDDNTESSEYDGTGAPRTVTSLLRFTDSGPSFQEFVDQQGSLSEDSSNSSSEEPEEHLTTNTAARNTASASDSGNTESSRDQSSEELANVESAVNIEFDREDIIADQEEESSDASVDDGGDSAEHGYVEIEPGYVGDHSDTESQCSEVEEDEEEDDIYVGNDTPRESIEGSVLGGGDLLNECLDMLSAVGYSDLVGNEALAEGSSSTVSADSRIRNEEGSNIFVTSSNDAISLTPIIEQSNSKERATVESVNRRKETEALHLHSKDSKVSHLTSLAEDAPIADSAPLVGNTKDRSLGNVISVLDDITFRAQSLLSGSENNKSGPSSPESAIAQAAEPTDRNFSGTFAQANLAESTDFGNNPRIENLDEGLPRSIRGGYKVKTDQSMEINQRNRSYYKAIFDVSSDDTSNVDRSLCKQKSAPAFLASPDISDGRDANVTPLDGIKLIGRKKEQDFENAVSPYSKHPRPTPSSILVASSVNDGSSQNEGTSAETTAPETSLFSSRHRILRETESDSSSVSSAFQSSASSNKHRISNRTDIDPNSSSTGGGVKLKYSVSDPVSKNDFMAGKQLNKHDMISEVTIKTKPKSNFRNENDFTNPAFRSDLKESAVDDNLCTVSSSNIVFDATKLKGESMRETAILSSSEDLPSVSAKNKPIGRTDQPHHFKEITLPSGGILLDSSKKNNQETSRRNMPLERSEPTMPLNTFPVPDSSANSSSQQLLGVSMNAETLTAESATLLESDKRKPPPLPPRHSSLDYGKDLEEALKNSTHREEIQPEAVRDPFQNITVRKDRRVKADNVAASGSHAVSSVVVQKEEHKTSSEISAASSRPSNTPTSDVIVPMSSVISTTTRDPSGDTRPRVPERARAIVRTTPDSYSDPFKPSPGPDKSRQREIQNGVRHDQPKRTDHKQRVRSPSEPPVPLKNERARSPSEPPSLLNTAQPPSIPLRPDRDRNTKLSIPVDSASAAPTPPAATSNAARHAAATRKRTTNVATNKERLNEAPSTGKGPKEIQNSKPPDRLQAIVHSDSQGATGGASSAERTKPPAMRFDDKGETLPSHWERAVDSHGRIYYIDHLHRTTTWKRPRKAQTANEGDTTTTAQLQQQHLQQYDRRYQSLRRTIKGQRRGGESNRPTILPQESRPTEPEQPRDRPRHLSRRQTSESSTPRQKTERTTEEASSIDGPPSKPQPTPADRDARSSFENTPGCRFIRRRDFFQFINNHGMASQFLHRSGPLKQTVNRIRVDPSKFERYQHSRELVTLLNFFSNPAAEIPSGWEKKADQYGQTYFIDHNTRSTTFIDPRLPLDEPTGPGPRSRPLTSSATATPEASSAKRPRQAATPNQSTPGSASKSQGATPTSRHATYTAPQPTSYNERVLAFLRQPAIEEILKRKDANLSSKNALRRKIMVIQRDGLRALDRLSNDIELVMLLSICEEEIQAFVVPDAQPQNEVASAIEAKETRESRPQGTRKPAPYRRDFEAKLRTFHRQMVQSGYGQGPGKIRMKIRRDHVVSDAFEQLMKQPPRALQKDRLYIKFLGEEGLDYGGPAREFFFLISRQCFDPYYGLFEYSASDTYTLQISPVAARFVTNSHLWLRFCGRIIALSLVHQHLLDVFFTRSIYKALLRQSYDLSDIESFDPEFHQSLSWILENDITDVLDMYFTTDEIVFDQVTERELKPGGKSIPVTDENKKEYVDLMIKWRMERGVGEQMKQLVDGFNEVLDLHMISIFDARELELVIAGTADIDVKDWRTNTDYRSGYHDKHPVIQWFWKAVDSVNNEQRLRLLQFVTGTSSIPFEGFSALRGSTGPRKFTVDCWGDPAMLPRAHTCFNRLDLPPYRNFEELYEKLLYAVEETSSFGIE